MYGLGAHGHFPVLLQCYPECVSLHCLCVVTIILGPISSERVTGDRYPRPSLLMGAHIGSAPPLFGGLSLRCCCPRLAAPSWLILPSPASSPSPCPARGAAWGACMFRAVVDRPLSSLSLHVSLNGREAHLSGGESEAQKISHMVSAEPTTLPCIPSPSEGKGGGGWDTGPERRECGMATKKRMAWSQRQDEKMPWRRQ